MRKTHFLALFCTVTFSGCVSSGRDFPIEKTSEIIPGTTTKAEVRSLLGDPVKRGITGDGLEQWGYFKVQIGPFGKYQSESYHVMFGRDGIVVNQPARRYRQKRR